MNTKSFTNFQTFRLALESKKQIVPSLYQQTRAGRWTADRDCRHIRALLKAIGDVFKGRSGCFCGFCVHSSGRATPPSDNLSGLWKENAPIGVHQLQRRIHFP
eukprot:jgi/Botrbrau1/18338/Bobra.0179s0065.1